MKNSKGFLFACLIAGLMIGAASVRVQAGEKGPMWIWYPEKTGSALTEAPAESRYFVKTVELADAVESAKIEIAADNFYKFYLNGKQIGEGDSWQQANIFDVKKRMVKGKNVIAIEAGNIDGPAGLIVKGVITTKDKKKTVVVSDRSWVVARKASEGWKSGTVNASFVKAAELGDITVDPWKSGGGVKSETFGQ